VNFPRSSGILLHPTSLPSPFGIGDLGDSAFEFADFLKSSGQRYWQMLPVGPTGYGDSPYQCFSAFAGNSLLISPVRLMEEGLVTAADLESAPNFRENRVDYGPVIDWKTQLLRLAFERFVITEGFNAPQFVEFTQAAAYWLDDYALFRALKNAQDGKSWNQWEPHVARREPEALRAAGEHLRSQILAEKFYQYLFFKQWRALRSYCHENGIQIVGDIPIFVAFDSADVWAHPDQFKLNEKGDPIVVAGVPPDYFSATGQLWGNPIYNWDRMRADGFRWWIDRVKATLELFDVVRIDHFRGFAASWEVPGGDKTAEHGQWVNVPGRQLFEAIKGALGTLPIIAEDLGVITPDVEVLRDQFGFPGMRIMQFAFGGDPKNHDLPHNYVRNCVAYTGTHDNDTVVGWFTSKAGPGSTRDDAQVERERRFCLEYLNSDGHEINWDFTRALMASVADIVVVPAQDLLGLGNESRMNLPATTSNNWDWRLKGGALTEEIGLRLRRMTEVYGRVVEQTDKVSTQLS
jgi:4-alpha-glucanotransferase